MRLQTKLSLASINVSNYTEVSATGAGQHRQLSSYTDINGIEYKVDDVWF